MYKIWRYLLLLNLLMLLQTEGGYALTAQTVVKRKGPIWIVENESILLSIDPLRGTLNVRDKRNGSFWRQPFKEVSHRGPLWRNIQQIPNGLSFYAPLPSPNEKDVRIEITIPPDLPQVRIGVDMDNRETEIEGFFFLEPFIGNLEQGVIVIADYCNGHIYPFEELPFNSWGADRLDMPWIGICDLINGNGYAMIIETSDDAGIYFKRVHINGKEVVIPRIRWEPSKGEFAYKRLVIYHFSDKGGYVALAKAYRDYAKEKGLLVTLREKMRRNPHLEKLLGAPDVWVEEALWKEDTSRYLPFALEAKLFGIKRMLIQGRSLPENIERVNSLGYITSEYDVYTDILPLEEGQDIDPLHGRVPADVILMANGERMPGIFTWDTKLQFMKRCPLLWVETAKVNIPKVLQRYPFLGRFLDVVTAEALYECYDENHPLTRSSKREASVELLRYVRSLGMVVGSEHGIWWAVPVIDYLEGMMSGNPAHFSWPAGQLIRPKSKDEEFSDPFGNKLPKWGLYEKWGIGHKWRVPLWELVFHDCVVSTWYWGDSTDFLLQSAPEVTPKKDAFNILYGTIPLLWSRTWHSNRDIFLRSYRNTCKLHEVVGDEEMLSHKFLTPDHDVQETRFSDGTIIIVNFGEKPYKLEWEGGTYFLPQNGFFVKGPRIEQKMILKDGKVITDIKAPGYSFSDEQGVEVEMEIVSETKMTIRVGKGKAVAIKPRELLPKWNLSNTCIFIQDLSGSPREEIPFQRVKDTILLGPFPQFTIVEARCD